MKARMYKMSQDLNEPNHWAISPHTQFLSFSSFSSPVVLFLL